MINVRENRFLSTNFAVFMVCSKKERRVSHPGTNVSKEGLMKLPHYHESLDTPRIGTLPKRSYYVPAGSEETALLPREASDRITMLSGPWAFFYAENDRRLPEGFYEEDFDFSDFNEIPVPSVWQNYGCGTHQYLNTSYPFPYDPPYVPEENPCGLYLRTFETLEDGYEKHLVFEGVDSCFYVWVNGELAGFAEGAHNMSEFDITDLIVSGENRIAVLVYKMCTGSYIEDQDKLRMNGIFRDVYILDRPKKRIADFYVRESFDARFKTADVTVDLELTGAASVSAKLISPEGETLEGAVTREGRNKMQAAFKVDNPFLWNAETPYLYTLVLSGGQETIVKRIGLRKIEVKNSVVYLNGKKIKFKGVNHHDSSPVNGYAMTREELEQDITLMKLHNINAIRTSHYPPAPYMLELCDELGLYVIDEADIECHNMQQLYGSQHDFEGKNKHQVSFSLMADDPDWFTLFFDRIESLVSRDKNAASVVIWSMGNESGYGGNFERSAAWIRAADPERLIHYEGALHAHTYDPSEFPARQLFSWKSYDRPDMKFDFSNIDFYSRMYPALAEWVEIEKTSDKPMILVEYCHAMGNGPGDLEDYWQEIYARDKMCGGFVWEWCDHAMYMGKTPDGRDKYFYGGDWGDRTDSFSFCMDGLVYPDRTPSTGLLEYKNVLRPIRLTGRRGNVFTFKNMLDFTNLSGKIGIEYELVQDGTVLFEGEAYDLEAKPRETFKLDLGEDLPAGAGAVLNFYYVNLEECDHLPEVYGQDQVILSAKAEQALSSSSAPDVVSDDDRIVVSGGSFRYIYDKHLGAWVSWVKDQKVFLDSPLSLNIWRAPTDNDMRVKFAWSEVGYDRMMVRVYKTTVSEKDGLIVIESDMGLGAESVQKFCKVKAVYEISSEGDIRIRLKGEKLPIMPSFPRFGLRAFLSDAFDTVQYTGYGPYESYIDKHQASLYGTYEAIVDGLHEDYLMPQENGSHWGCTSLIVSDKKDRQVVINGNAFSFNLSRYSEEELTKKAHNFELERSGKTVLCLDGHQAGIGSASCGPELLSKYRVPEKMKLDVVIRLS